ncbi:MAG: S41 family peptidase [Rhodospirillaceae bacterium]
MLRAFRAISLCNWPGLAAAALLLVCGCVTDTVAGAGPLPVSEQVFSVAYNRIFEIFLQPVDMARLSIDGLSGLRTLDHLLTVIRLPQSVEIKRGSRLVTEFAVPDGNDPNAWAALTTIALERARQFSPELHDATPDQLYQAVFDGLVADLDAYSRYTNPVRAGNERAIRDGYGGVGMSLDLVAGRYTVRELVSRGPAERAGITVGELIEAIDGTATKRMNEQSVRDSLRGPPGSLVHLTVGNMLNGAMAISPQRAVTLHRERVVSNSVRLRLDNDIIILKVERFNAATAVNLREAIVQAQSKLGRRAVGFILDLRGNPGGLLDQAVAVSDLFLRRGRIVSTAGRHPDSWQRFDAIGDDLLHEWPVVVLVDGRSASASEIVAAALQDSGRAIVVGASSYGKGSVQTVTRLPNDGELFLTWSRIYAPSGYTLHRQGVQPTICTSRDESTVDGVLAPLRNGQLEQPSVLARWRALAPDDESALAHLRQACPWKAHEPELDILVAERLLKVPALYRSALAQSTTAVAER